MPWNEFPIVRVLIPFVFGICIGVFHLLGFFLPIWFFLALSVLVFVLSVVLKRFVNLNYNFFIGFLINALFVILGIFLSQDYYGYREAGYYGNQVNKANFFVAQLTQNTVEKENSLQLQVEIKQTIDSSTTKNSFGKVVLYLKKDSLARQLRYGDILIIQNSLSPIAASKNPYQFDIQTFFKRKGIQHQAYLRESEWRCIEKAHGFSLIRYSLLAQEKMLKILENSMQGKDEFAVASALLLGYRSDISDELLQAYSGSGAMHVLSVSGLHVGIIFLMLNFLLELFPFFKRKSLTKTLLLLIVIWSFAFITGLSASVLRAAAMITFVIVGSNINRRTSVYNSISVSALLLLIINPYLLFDLGFQLSYLAVIAIVSLQPFIQNLWSPANKILQWSWSLMAVSLAAQIGTIPLSFLYFHQFPNVFLLTNFIVIPAAFLILMMGVITLAFSWWSFAAWLFGVVLNFMVHWLNWSITFIENMPYAVLRNIRFDSIQFILLSGFILFLSVAIIHKRKKSLLLALIFFGFYMGYDSYVRIENRKRIEFVIYQTPKNSVFAVFDQNKLSYFADTAALNSFDNLRFQIDNQRIQYGIADYEIIDMDSEVEFLSNNFFKQAEFVNFGSIRSVLIRNDWEMPNTDNMLYVNYLIIDNDPKFSFEDLLKTYNPQMVIITARNKYWKTKGWKEKLAERKIPFYDIAEKGAFSCVITE